jgi:hypothetical protein
MPCAPSESNRTRRRRRRRRTKEEDTAYLHGRQRTGGNA